MKKISLFLAMCFLLFSLISCGYAGGESQKLDAHRWSRFYADDVDHWRVCQDEGCEAVDRAMHTTQTPVCMKTPTCDVCGEKYGGPMPHLYDENGECTRCAEKEKSEGLEYFHAEGYYVVEGFGDCTRGEVEISPVHNGLPVTEIGDHAFAEDHLLESIIIPDSISKIGWAAFSGCDHLKEVTLPGTLKDIEGYIFNGCTELTAVKLPAGVEHISDHAFYHCESLTLVEIPATVTDIDGMPFGDCDSLQEIVYKGTKEQWANIDKSQTAIPKNVAVHCIDGDWVQD